MHKIHTEILVIGGGATGTGILRDLAMRGFGAILVERRDLTDGTTGRFHGLLHSGGRYAVKDPEAARECIQENRVLRKIMPHCIEDTGGFFVLTPGDDPSYAARFVSGCQEAGIPVEEVPIRKMLAREPHLNPQISRCFQVPDGAADGFAAAHANVVSAREYGAQTLTYHEVVQLISDNGSPGQVIGARCHDLVRDEIVEISADLVVNAAGAWVGKIGATAGVEIAIRPGKGTMLAVSHRVVNTVINRLKMPADGDILVPAHTVAVMGTTDEQVPDPDRFAIEPWEVQLMLTEGEKLIPGFNQLRMLRAWAGVRPLYQETKTNQSRDITRSFVLLDHEVRDGVAGLLTITSGKWTTYRQMAEATVDKVCEKLGTERKCRTHLEELPSLDGEQKTGKSHHHLGERLAHIEHAQTYGDLVCECELATRKDIEWAITKGEAKTLDDVRRDVRLGMGPCQGGFCTFRAAGILHQLSAQKTHTAEETNIALRDFLQERWKGLLPILWGKQLRQESLNELIYLNVLNIDHLPGASDSRLASENYLVPERQPQTADQIQKPEPKSLPSVVGRQRPVDTLIIGAGLAGLTAAWQLVMQGQSVRVVAKGWGATHWASGCIDVLGYYPINNTNPVDSPVSAIARLTMEHPEHPYAHISLKQIGAALKELQQLCSAAGYPLRGALENNWLLPTAAGTFRPTCLAPETMIAGDLSDPTPMLLVGIEGYHDFYPHLAAANLQAQGVPATAVMIQLPSLQTHRQLDTMALARYFDDLEATLEVTKALKPYLNEVGRVGFPAVLGLRDAPGVVKALESQLGCRVFEITGLPPSIPGLRLHQVLVEAVRRAGGNIQHGMEAIGTTKEGVKISGVLTESAARPTLHQAENFILASGGILGGGIYTNHSGAVYDPLFDLPLETPEERFDWLQREFLHPQGHAIFQTGVIVDENLRTPYENLYAIGGSLAGDFVRERSLEGAALISGYRVGEVLG